jgi:phosphopantothenoylcysteine decarboxylase/phosphopantothenate--cysteine ligase
VKLLITAGPTHEPIDAVRYLANRSSGRMGLALAQAAIERGIDATLLLGPVSVQPPQHPHLVVRRFQTSAELRGLLAELWPSHQVLVMAAAVADYLPARTTGPGQKLERRAVPWTLELVPAPDLLAEAAASARPGQITVGFALEPPDRLLESAARKLTERRLHAIVANPLETIGSDRVRATLLLRDGRALTPPGGECTKIEFARWLVDQLGEISRAVEQ